MTTYIPPTSGTPVYPDIQPGQLTQTNGNPALPGTSFAGPLLAGGVQVSDGTNNLAGVGGTTGTANRGWCVMAQSCVITQATNDGTTGQFACPIVIPAQSQILAIYLMVTTAWTTGTTTLGIGTGASATAFTTSTGVQGSTIGQVVVATGSSNAQTANWDNVGTSDVQIVVLSGGSGSGIGTLTVVYIPGIDLVS